MRQFLALIVFVATASCNAVLGLSDPVIALASDGGDDTTARSDTEIDAGAADIALPLDSTGADSVVPDSVVTDSAVSDSAVSDSGIAMDTATMDADAPCSETYRARVMEDAPLYYWRLDEASGTTALDEGTAKLNGAYVGAFTLGAAGALVCPSRAARFDTGSVQVNGTPAFDGEAGKAKFSVEFWVRPDTVDTTGRYLVGRMGSSGYFFVSGPGGVVFQRANAGGESVPSGTPLTAGAWHHVVGVYDGANMLLYVDGSVKSVPSSVTNPTAAWTFSVAAPANGTTAPPPTNGRFDEVAIYDKALAGARVQAHYNAARGL